MHQRKLTFGLPMPGGPPDGPVTLPKSSGFGPRGKIDALHGVTTTAKSDKLPSGGTLVVQA